MGSRGLPGVACITRNVTRAMARYAVRKLIHTAFVALHRGDADHPRGQAVARAVPGGDHRRRLQADHLQAARRVPSDRFRNDRLRAVGARVRGRGPDGDYCGDQAGSTVPSPSVALTEPPFMTQRATLPEDELRHRMSALPSPLWSPTSAMIHSRATAPSPVVLATVPPFISQMATTPVDEFRHRMSALPSPLKSLAAATVQASGTAPRPAV